MNDRRPSKSEGAIQPAEIALASTVSFDEFHALRNRKRVSDTQTPTALATVPLKEIPVTSPWSPTRRTIGHFIERMEVQTFILLILCLDMSCVMVELSMMSLDTHTGNNHSPSFSSFPRVTAFALRLMASFSGFSLVFYLAEIGASLYAFQVQYMTHLGYMVDVGVVTLVLMHEGTAGANVYRLLGLLRFWRVIRLVNTLLLQEKNAHHATALELVQAQLATLHVTTELQRVTVLMGREKESQKGLEQSLAAYKDELETLQEALTIAALAVAKATIDEVGEMTTAQWEAMGESEEPTTLTKSTMEMEMPQQEPLQVDYFVDAIAIAT